MCATCVAQGAPYVAGSVVALRVMASGRLRRRGDRRPPADAVAAAEADRNAVDGDGSPGVVSAC